MIPPLAFKFAAQMIQEQLLPQAAEPADISPELQQEPAAQPGQVGGSVLTLLGKQNATATEPAPKVVTDTGQMT